MMDKPGTPMLSGVRCRYAFRHCRRQRPEMMPLPCRRAAGARRYFGWSGLMRTLHAAGRIH